jgi:hypothetical protein
MRPLWQECIISACKGLAIGVGVWTLTIAWVSIGRMMGWI